MTSYFKKFRNFTRSLIFAIALTGCFHSYFKASEINIKAAQAKSVDDLQQQNRYFILRNEDKAYYMNNTTLSNNRQTLDCILDSLPVEHRLYLTKGRGGVMKYKKQNKKDVAVLNEAHFYVPVGEETSVGKYTLQLDKLEKIEVIKKDNSRTTGSSALGVLGCIFGVFAVLYAMLAGDIPQ